MSFITGLIVGCFLGLFSLAFVMGAFYLGKDADGTPTPVDR